jgi:hypothetical protein
MAWPSPSGPLGWQRSPALTGSRRAWRVAVGLAVVLAGAAARCGGSHWPFYPLGCSRPSWLFTVRPSGPARRRCALERLNPDDDQALVFTSPMGTPLRHSNFYRRAWLPAVAKVGLSGITFMTCVVPGTPSPPMRARACAS